MVHAYNVSTQEAGAGGGEEKEGVGKGGGEGEEGGEAKKPGLHTQELFCH